MSIYVNRNTGLLCEVQLYETFVLIRPLDPAECRDIQKMGHGEFDKTYLEYSGNQEDVYDYLAGRDNVIQTIQ